MFAFRAVRVLIGFAILAGYPALAPGDLADKLTFSGRVVLADGSPAVGAIVERQEPGGMRSVAIQADADGRFQAAARFENGVHLHARSADGGQQAIYRLSAPAVRTTLRTPQEIKLGPATSHKVVVRSGDMPVNNALIVVTGDGFNSQAETDRDGQAEVRIPADVSLRTVAAFHPSLGVGGEFHRQGSVPQENYTIALQPPAPHEIHLIDDNGQPVADFELGVDVSVGDYGFIVVSPLTATHVRTDKAGVAKILWAPRDNLRIVSTQIRRDAWKEDAPGSDRLKEGITTQKLRRKMLVTGRLIVPKGVDASGILISGSGFGTGHRIDLASARAAADGTFTLMVPAFHSYVIGIQDNEWACDPWTGDLRTDGEARQDQVQLSLYPATPVTVRVTRGPENQAVPNTSVELETERQFKFTNDDGKRGNAVSGVRSWLMTDSDGVARVGVGRGEFKISLRAGEWLEERKLDVNSADPVEVEFHRAWIGKRKIVGRLIDSGKPFAPSPTATIMAWTARSRLLPLQHAPRLLDGGRFELEFDAEQASLSFFDAEQKRCGSCEIGPQDTDVTVETQPTASYGGTLVDPAGKPIADHEVFLMPKENFRSAIVSQQPGASGKFHWDAVPSRTALRVGLRGDQFGPRYQISSDLRHFEPGEARENDVLQGRAIKNKSATARAELLLAESVPLICRDARLNAMRALVVLEGDESETTRNLVSRLLDYDGAAHVLAYRVLSLSPERLKAEARTIADRKWPEPASGEVVCLVLDDQEAVSAEVRLKSAQLDASLAEGQQFLIKHRPAQRDAVALLAAAQDEARTSGRRLWVVSGGPRCGPCFRLARWMDDQHAVLEKDYVIVKINGGVDKDSDVVDRLLPGSRSSGIPYHAIMEPDGKVLITSTGPLGNIGMPSEIEDIRHLKRMFEQTGKRLSAADIATLEKSLGAK